MDASSVFLIDPGSEFRRTYGELVRDIDQETSSGQSDLYGSVLNILKLLPKPAGDLEFLQRQLRMSAATMPMATSGSSGEPRIVEHRFDSLIRSVKTGDSRAADIWGLTYTPNSFAGIQVLLQAILNQNLIINLAGLPMPNVAACIDQFRISHLSATPTFYRMLMAVAKPEQSFPSVKQVTSGGERLDDKTCSAIGHCFPNARLTNVYASTEAGSLLTADGSEFEVPIRLSDKIKLKDCQLLVHRSLLGKFHDESGGSDAAEYFETGDRVEIVDEDPLRFVFANRDAGKIVVGGINVNIARVEQQLMELPEVIDARVFAKPNSVTGNIVCCELVLRVGKELDEVSVRERLGETLRPFEIPRLYSVVEELTRGKTGKKKRVPVTNSRDETISPDSSINREVSN